MNIRMPINLIIIKEPNIFLQFQNPKTQSQYRKMRLIHILKNLRKKNQQFQVISLIKVILNFIFHHIIQEIILLKFNNIIAILKFDLIIPKKKIK